jgi:hypothetical protein
MSFASRAAYRVRQLRSALSPRIRRSEKREAKAVLGATLYPLFKAMQPADQRHCLDVYHLLRRSGEDDVVILAAALLHDAGKGGDAAAEISTWHRVAHVALPDALLERLAPRVDGLARLADHGEATLQLVRAAGASEDLLAVLEAMEAHRRSNPRAARLVAADEAC